MYEYQSVECAFTSHVIIKSGMLVMYCVQFVMSVTVASMVSWCIDVMFLGAMYMLAMVLSLKCCVCILRSCISVLSVLMTCGVSMCVNVVSDLMYVMRPPPWLQTTQPTSAGAVTANSSCCANCIEPPRPQQWGPDLPFFGHADPLDGRRCCSQKRVMSRPIQVLQL